MVERFKQVRDGRLGWGLAPRSNGDLCRYSDYADLERQIAELRAERDKAQRHTSELLARIHRDGGHYEADHGTSKAAADADTIVANLYAAEAENARLRALPLKDEVERVLEEMLFLAEAEHMCLLAWNQSGSAANYDGITERARALLSRLRAGEQEGWRLPEGTLAVYGKDVIIAYDDFKDARRAFSILENVIGAAPSEQGGDDNA